MQVFRLMGMPDKVIAFDELPEDLVKGFEMIRADGFPRHWKEWLGTKKKITPIPPEKDFLTGGVRKFDPIIEEANFFYLVDYMLQPIVEKWQVVCDYVRQHVDKDVRLMDKIDDMALPLAPDKSSSVTLEPEEVVVIPLPRDAKIEEKPEAPDFIKCDEPGCISEYSGKFAKQALRMHKQKKHAKEKVA